MAKRARPSSDSSPIPKPMREIAESTGFESGECQWSFPSKVELEGGINQTRSSVDIEDLTEGDFVPGYEPSGSSIEQKSLTEGFSESFGDVDPESIIGNDDRKRVFDLTEYPFNMICRIVTVFPNGARERSTGWFGGFHTLFTTGHSVYKQENGGYARSISVWSPTLGQLKVSNWQTSKRWANNGDYDWDIGVVGITDTADSHMGFEAKSDEFLKKARLNIFGYPGDKPDKEMWGQTNGAARVYRNMMTYIVDTYAGQSGAPVFTMVKRPDGLRPCVLGIHNYGVGRANETANSCTRINSEVYDTLRFWKSRYEK